MENLQIATLCCHYCAEETNIHNLTHYTFDCGNRGNYCTECITDVRQCGIPYSYCREQYISNKHYIDSRINIQYGNFENDDEDSNADFQIVEMSYNFMQICMETKQNIECPICYDTKPCYELFSCCKHLCCFDCLVQMDKKNCYYGCK